MSYIEETLSKEEKIILVPHLHWWNYIKPILNFIISFFFFILLLFTMTLEDKNISLNILLTLAFIFSIVPALVQIIGVKFIELACTNKRVVFKKGIIMRNANELQLGKIESVEVKQSIMGRILGFGDVLFSGTGTSKVVFKCISDALRIKGQIADILEESKK